MPTMFVNYISLIRNKYFIYRKIGNILECCVAGFSQTESFHLAGKLHKQKVIKSKQLQEVPETYKIHYSLPSQKKTENTESQAQRSQASKVLKQAK